MFQSTELKPQKGFRRRCWRLGQEKCFYHYVYGAHPNKCFDQVMNELRTNKDSKSSAHTPDPPSQKVFKIYVT